MEPTDPALIVTSTSDGRELCAQYSLLFGMSQIYFVM